MSEQHRIEQQIPAESGFMHSLHSRFHTIVRLYLEMENTPRRFGTGELLTSTQIHLIEVIGDFSESLSVTDLARKKSVSKGAISQNLKKLEQEGLVFKETDSHNLSRTVVKLTNKGKTAYYAHRTWHEKADGGFRQFMKDLSPEEKKFMLDTLSRVETMIRNLMKT